jgi:mannose-6-phosphate isomerase-like protein (cupin superfamily)
MSDYAIKRIDEMEAVFRGAFKRARAELGVEAFGMQVLDLPPNLDQFPEHDHAESGQEEVYVVLRGRGEVEIDGERHAIDPDTIIRVGAQAKRKLITGEEPMRVLALGGVPGGVYEPPDVTKLGEPDPLAQQS